MINVVINHQKSFAWDKFPEVDAMPSQDGQYHLWNEGKRYTIRLVEEDRDGRPIKVEVNGKIFDVHIKTELDLLIESMGLNSFTAPKIQLVNAPMPGLVIHILTKEGQSVAKGDSLLVMEAMKMENIIKSPGNGIIHKIFISKGQSVAKGEVLIEFV
jgi:biotin carboxyl carrier protein